MKYCRSGIIYLAIITLLFIAGCGSNQEKLLNESQRYFQNGDYKQALAKAEAAVDVDPDTPGAYELLSKIHLKLGNAQEAYQALLKIEQLQPDNLTNQLRIATFLLLGKNMEKAEQRVNHVLKKNPDSIDARYLQAEILAARKAPFKTLEAIYQQVLSLDREQAKAHALLARLYNNNKNFQAAEKHLKEAARIAPGNKNYFRALYLFYLTRKQWDNAGKTLEAMVANFPDDPEPLILSGNLNAAQKNFKTAETQLMKALAIEPDSVRTHMVIARFLAAQQRKADAEKYFEAAIKLEPGNYHIQNTYADFHLANHDIKKAESVITEILKARPDFLPAKVIQGKISIARKDFDRAANQFRALLKKEPQSDMLNFFMGSVLFEKKEYDAAESCLKKALLRNPGLIRARLVLADIQFKKGEVESAEESLKIILEKAPSHYKANLLYGNVAMARHKLDLAKTVFQKLINQEPENPSAYYRLGLARQAGQEYRQAKESLEKALTLNPRLMDVFSNLIAVYIFEKNYDAALARCDAVDGHDKLSQKWSFKIEPLGD